MTKREIERLGFDGGKADVDEYARNLRCEGDADGTALTEDEIAERLLATLRPNHLSWDESARNAGTARMHKVFGSANVERYYAAYNRGAEAQIQKLTA